jgi:peptide chain release factor subunit 1
VTLGSAFNGESSDRLEIFRLKRLVKSLDEAQGNGTSVITLAIPAKYPVSRVTKMLTDEEGSARCIKSRANRQSVLTALTTAREQVKQYDKVPANGLFVFCGIVTTVSAKEKMCKHAIEPPKPITKFTYLCDNHFHTDALSESLKDTAESVGFIIIDGKSCLFALLIGSEKRVLQSLSVDLPNKHGRGGQSALRFARLRLEKRHNYLRKVAELATQHFVKDGSTPSVAKIVLAGSSGFKNELFKSNLFDSRLKPIVAQVVDVAYGGENGLAQAMELAAPVLAQQQLLQERKVLQNYFEAISRGTGRYCFGVADTMLALEMG